MDRLRTVFSQNLRRLRAGKTQSEIAEAADIPFRSYQHAEYGYLPREGNLTAIAKALGVDEIALFQDPKAPVQTPKSQLLDWAASLTPKEAEQYLDLIRKHPNT